MLSRTHSSGTTLPASAMRTTDSGHHWRAGLLALALVVPNAAWATPVDQFVSQISQSQYTTYVQTLQDFETRYFNTAGNAAALSYIYNEFAGFGLSVAYDPFSYGGGTYNNVVATLPGRTNPGNVYIVGAHMDSTSPDPAHHAPGADDNASGMAAVLSIAKALAQSVFDATIKFIGFNAEEQGLRGSLAYATEARANGENVVGMLNFDMIAYSGTASPKNVFLAGNSALVNAMVANANVYTSLNTQISYSNIYGSDHYYFHSSQFPGSSSAFAIEAPPSAIPSYNPNYHKITDTIDYLDFAYASDITRIGVATIAQLAGPIPEPSTLVCILTGIVFLARRKQFSRHLG